MKKKYITALCALTCAATLCGGLAAVNSAADTTQLTNVAVDADTLHINTLAPAGSVSVGSDGVSITNWNSGNNTTAGVTVKDKVGAGATVNVTFNAFTEDTANRFIFQLGPTASYNTESLWAWGSSNNPSGNILNMEFKTTWLELTKKANGTYDSSLVVTGNDGGSMFGASDFLDGTDHELTIIKEDTTTGIEITILVDGGKYVQDYAVEDTSLQGDYYFTIGMVTWDTVTPADGEYCNIKSITSTAWVEGSGGDTGDNGGDSGSTGGGSELPNVPAVDESLQNLATDETLFKGATRAIGADSLKITDNGITLSNYAYEKRAAAFLNDQVAANSTVSFTFNANGAFSSEQLADTANYPENGRSYFSIALLKSEKLYTTSFDFWQQNGAIGKEVLLEFSGNGWTSLKTYTLGKYESVMEASEKITLADGNGNGPFNAGSNLLDGTDHTVSIITEDTDDGMLISVVVDGQWYVYQGKLIGEEYKGHYYVAFGLGFNFVVGGTSDKTQFAQITQLRVSDFAPEEVLPDYEAIYDDAYNLVTNKYNFAFDENIITMESSGLSLNNVVSGIGNGFSITNGKVNEFDWAFKFNLSLYSNWDATGKPEDVTNVYDYSMLKFGFMMDAGLKPTGLQSSFKNMYYGFSIGKDYRAIPGSYADKTCFLSFARYKGFSDSTQLDSYVNYKFGYDLVDGNDHWIVLKVRNVDDATGKGVSMELWLDGKCEITLTDYNSTRDDSGVTYDWNVYDRAGYLCMWTGSNNSEALAQGSSCLFKEMYVVSYDENADGAYMEQAPKPDFQIMRNYNFSADAVYYVGEDIRLNLANAFVYEGDSKLTYTVTHNTTGEAIGSVNAGGQWIYTPTQAEFFKIRVTANSEDGKTQFNIVDINIEVEGTGGGDDGSGGDGSSDKQGCGSSIATGLVVGLIGLGAALVLRRKENN